MSWINKLEESQTTAAATPGTNLHTVQIVESKVQSTNDENQPPYGEKRPRDEENGATTSPSAVERPAKLAKLDTKDSIRNHLPEIVGSGEREESFLQTSWLQIGEQLLEQAKKENTISILPSAKCASPFLLIVVLGLYFISFQYTTHSNIDVE
ncbi:hypothetical protein BJ165DRAFT_107174 [Panaeolus papilionaceus]|nr:hypothetical protein BJ165DRAFT_107174 [Panaeolus papilionaceus]